MARPANAVDFWRGFALVTIFVNHVPGLVYERITHRNVSISDSAELFVFLAGWSLGLMVARFGPDYSSARLFVRLGGRAIKIYAAQILISSLALAMLAATALLWDNPLILEWHNAAAVFQEPQTTHIGLVLLTHQLGYFDILPLYVVLMLLAPFLAIIDRYAHPLLLPLSLGLYFASLIVPFTAPTWPIPGQWFFNPFTWQAIFVLGFALSRDEGAGAWVRRHLTGLRRISLPIVIASAILVWFNWFPDPTRLPEPKLLFLNGKSFLTPMRLLQFLALAAVFSAAFPLIYRAIPWISDQLSLLGRNSLNVFCVASLLSLSGQIIRFVYLGSFFIDTLVFVVGVGLLWLTAWVSEWQGKS
ncbi:MAG: OpgC domain-containing protein [Hyphomicrobiales bacterium]|nr:MAG: OpgC domain-containing protein [Hyphomicrobiales bacterium]